VRQFSSLLLHWHIHSKTLGHPDVAVGVSRQLMSSAADIDQQIYNCVVELVAYVTRLKNEQTKPETRLFHDAGVDGINDYNLLIAVCDEFNFDPKSGMCQ
jgi:acyl carrier protein